MKLTYEGHSCFMVESGQRRVIIDPFLTGNPFARIKPQDVKVDAVLVTHGHSDHLGDAVEISKRNKAPVIGTFELVNHCISKGATGHAMHLGGSRLFPFGKVKLTIAFHGSSSDGGTLGNPCGFLLTMDGTTLYHAGDTALFADMTLIGQVNPIDCALLPIGDNFTMGVDDAILAARMLNPRMAIPMHYNTFEVIRQDPEAFILGVRANGMRSSVMAPGESIEL